MAISFLSERNDVIFRLAYKYFSERYECKYNEINETTELIVANDYIPTNKKIIFYATNPFNDFSNPRQRRFFLSWMERCEALICCSAYLAKCLYDNYRIRPLIQHPYTPERRQLSRNCIVYNKFSDIESISREISETFININEPEDVADAKVYLCDNDAFLDLGLCYASECGVPVITYDNPALREFLEPQDTVIPHSLPIPLKIQCIKKTLKEHEWMKSKSKKYSNMATLEDKIKQALGRRNAPAMPPKPPMVTGRRQRIRQHNVSTIIPSPPPLRKNTIYVTGSITNIAGYDNFIYETVRGLRSLNIDVRINSLCGINPQICPSYFKDIYLAKPNDAWEIIMMPPCILDRWRVGKKSIIYTMWETDYLDPLWVKQLNNAAFVIVPSQWAVDCFKKSGVSVPIHKIALGYDPLVFNPRYAWPNSYTFGTAASLTAGGIRKNTDKIIELFQRAFPGVNNVRLKVKITPGCRLPTCKDPRVEILRNFIPPGELANWYRSINVFVNGSYAEGFGLHLIESMACGRPIISTEYSAVTEYFDEEVGWVVDHEIVPASGDAYSGYWGKPVEKSMIKAMQDAYDNPEETIRKGEKAFLRARSFSWKDMGIALAGILMRKNIIV